MIIAQQKKRENIAEYLLYMWQIEDINRANRCDMASIRRTVVARYSLPEEDREEIGRWYEELTGRMQREGIVEKGHLQELTDIIAGLTDLHLRLIASPEEMLYRAAYHKILPHIVQLRARSGGEKIPEMETCFTAVYGYLVLKMQQKEVSVETEEAVKQIVSFLSILAGKI